MTSHVRRNGFRLRRIGQFLQDRWPFIPASLGLLGVGGGWIGYERLDPSASLADSLYASLQLLVLNGPTDINVSGPPQSLPLELSIARFVSAAVPASALILLAVRFLANRADLISSWRAKRHLVVFGSTTEASQVALAGVHDAAAARDWRPVVLVGLLPAAAVGELRAAGVAVLEDAQGSVLSHLLSHAAEIVIVDNNDDAALRRLAAVHAALGKSGTHRVLGARPQIRVVLESTEMARMQRSLDAASGDFSTTMASLAEVVSQQVTSPDLFPPLADGRSDHVVIVGSGEVAMEIALDAFQRRFVRGRPMRIDLFANSTDTWQAAVMAQVPRDVLSSSDESPSLFTVREVVTWLPEPVAEDVAAQCRSTSEQHQIFVAGLTDQHTYMVSHYLAKLLPSTTIVTVLQDRFLDSGAHGADEASLPNWRTVQIGQLLTKESVLRLAAIEQVARQFNDEFERFLQLPGSLPASPFIRGYGSLSAFERRAWAEALVGDLLSHLADAGSKGAHLEPGLDLSLQVLGGPALRVARAVIEHHVRLLAPENPALPVPGTVLRMASRLPDIATRAGAHLRGEPADVATLSPSEVERLAQSIHASYLASVHASNAAAAQPLPHVIAWESMNEEQREKNRRPARDLESRLLNTGYRLAPLQEEGSRVLVLDDELVERLAEDEHEAWMLTQMLNGYRLGAYRAEDQRLHPMMIAYCDLDESIKERDREPVRQTPALLAEIGWGVAPL